VSHKEELLRTAVVGMFLITAASCQEDRILGILTDAGRSPVAMDTGAPASDAGPGTGDGPAPPADAPVSKDAPAPATDAPVAAPDTAPADRPPADGPPATDARACTPIGPLCGPLPMCTAQSGCPNGGECRIAGNSCSGCCYPRAADAAPPPTDAQPALPIAPSCQALPACGVASACECCPAGGPRMNCICSRPCNGDSDCPASAPHCNKSPDGSRAFCTPDALFCCWLCR
jgi:hypothetical protein